VPVLRFHGSPAAVATRAARRPALEARACSCRLCGVHVNLGVGGVHGPIGGKWQWPALHLREVLVVLAVLAKCYGLVAVVAAGLWRGGYWVDMNTRGGSRVLLAPSQRSN
jgi:hypothetical protein